MNDLDNLSDELGVSSYWTGTEFLNQNVNSFAKCYEHYKRFNGIVRFGINL